MPKLQHIPPADGQAIRANINKAADIAPTQANQCLLTHRRPILIGPRAATTATTTTAVGSYPAQKVRNSLGLAAAAY
jgi:hypothetical protein